MVTYIRLVVALVAHCEVDVVVLGDRCDEVVLQWFVMLKVL